ncbi:hypothetical protein C9374_007275 [Naegleria lovaniensis]|uniref:Guanine nucleotide-binding protein subunit beta-like protein n=1 Tax=Naegleria lovaniensis TaxID=51637 RepID=A0AA88KSJ6_NAELO|nr:uncharacterized protein C9374_007275 [Naegleria lovaniensis]KAG2393744.1 hypothetical protein C9374_007275 [Naegleria lovaniensis]
MLHANSSPQKSITSIRSKIEKRKRVSNQFSATRLVDEVYGSNHSIVQSLGWSHKLVGHHGCVNAINFNTNGDLIVTGSDDETVKIWNTWTGKCLTTLSGHISNVFATNFFNSNHHQIISGGNDSDVRFYDIEKDVCTVYQHHTKKVLKIATCPLLPHCFYSCSADGSCRMFDVRCKYSNSKIEQEKIVKETRSGSSSSNGNSSTGNTHHPSRLNAYSNYNDTILPQAIGGGRAISSQGGVVTTTTTTTTNPTLTGSVLNDHSYGSSSSSSSTNSNTHPVSSLVVNYRMLEYHTKTVPTLYSVELNPFNPHQLIIGSYLGDTRLFDTRRIENFNANSYVNIYRPVEPNYDPRDYEVTGCAFSQDGSKIVSTHLGDYIYLFDRERNFERDEGVDYSRVIPSPTAGASSSFSQSLLSRRSRNNSTTTTTRTTTTTTSGRTVHESVNGSFIEEEEEDGERVNVTMNDSMEDPTAPSTCTYERKFTGHCSRQTIKGVNFFGLHSEYVISGSDDSNIFIWERESGELVRVLSGHEDIVNTVVCHPEYPVICSGGIDDFVNVWAPCNDSLLLSSEEMKRRKTHLESVMEENAHELDDEEVTHIPAHLLQVLMQYFMSRGADMEDDDDDLDDLDD